MNVPIHQLGHTIDLVVFDNVFFYHKSVMFSVPWVFNSPKVTKITSQSRLITSTTSKAFSLGFWEAIKLVDVSQCELLFRLNSTCVDVLDSVALNIDIAYT